MAVVGFITAVGVSFAVAGIVYVLGPRLGVVDVPDKKLKTHSRPVTPLGGVAVLLGLHIGLAVAGAFDVALLVATILVWVVGLIDDLRGLSPPTRLLGAALAGFLLAILSDLPDGLLFPIFWVVVTVLVVNSVNLLDGLDGLAGSVAVISLLGLWWFGWDQGLVGPHFYLISIGAILGFLYWNWTPARLFLGDNGAYVIGVTLTWAALRASPDGTASLVAVAIIGVPILELMITMTRRLLVRKPLMSGDRDHTYDRLHRSGISTSSVVAIFVAAQIIWLLVIVWVAIAAGDLAALITAVLLGAGVVAVASFRLKTEQSG